MLTRRRFLAASAVTLASGPSLLASRADKVRLAVIGVGNRGAANLAGVAQQEIVALCDVDPANAGKAREQFPKAEFFNDYRTMYDKMMNRVDAVVVSTPDHTHAHASLIALKSRKHLYCEKPLARTVEEVRRMMAAAKEANVMTQMGTQIHAGENYRRVVELIRSGQLGRINSVYVWLAGKPQPGKRLPNKPDVAFNLDVWRGPVTQEVFTADHTGSPYKHPWPHFHWRYWWEFGGGQLADFGCHFMDLPFWALNLGAPTRIKAKGTPPEMPADNTVPAVMEVDYEFPMPGRSVPLRLHWSHGHSGPLVGGIQRSYDGYGSGILFVGTQRSLISDYSKHKLFNSEMHDKELGAVKIPDPSIAKSAGHHQEWIDAIQGKGKPLCEFSYAGNLAQAVLLGNVSYRAGAPIEWDNETGKVTNLPRANDFVSCEIRKGWELA